MTDSSGHFWVFYSSSPGRWNSFFFFFSLSILILLPSTQTRSDKGTPSSTVPSTPTTCLINEASQLNAAGKNCLAKAAFKIQHLWLLLWCAPLDTPQLQDVLGDTPGFRMTHTQCKDHISTATPDNSDWQTLILVIITPMTFLGPPLHQVMETDQKLETPHHFHCLTHSISGELCLAANLCTWQTSTFLVPSGLRE